MKVIIQGGGAGVMVFLKENIFINAEYEIAYASNSWYKDGWINTVLGGIGSHTNLLSAC